MRTRRIALPVMALLIALLVAGCGDDSSTSQSTSSLSKNAFIKKADAICQGGNNRMEAELTAFLIENKNVKHATKADFEELVGKVLVPNLRREIKEIQALGVPSGDEDRVGEILTALEEGLETAEANPELAAESSDAVFGISSRLAREYGLEVCGTR